MMSSDDDDDDIDDPPIENQQHEESMSDSISLNGFDDDGQDAEELHSEREGIALLRQIFPDETTEELRKLHRRRLSMSSSPSAEKVSSSEEKDAAVDGADERRIDSSPPLVDVGSAGDEHDDSAASALRRRILLERVGNHLADNSPRLLYDHHHHRRHEYILPHDFLRLPPSIAIRRYEGISPNEDRSAAATTTMTNTATKRGRWRYQLLRDLERRAVVRHELHRGGTEFQGSSNGGGHHVVKYFTRAVFRDAGGGLGISLCETGGNVLIYSIEKNGRHQMNFTFVIVPGDQLIGINGTALLETRNSGESLVRHAVATIKESPDPVVLHLARATPTTNPHRRLPPPALQYPNQWPATQAAGLSPPRTTGSWSTHDSPGRHLYEVELDGHDPVYRSTPTVDDAKRPPLIHPFAAALRARGMLHSYEQERETTVQLADMTNRVHQWEMPSTIRYMSEWEDDQGSESYQPHLWNPLEGVRKALSVRILNSFADGTESAYCIWVHDAEAGIEFFSPVRYLRDFCDLRAATIQLCPSLANLPFPRAPFTIFGSPVRQETPRERDAKCRTLENFVRSLCTLLYTYRGRDVGLPELAEVAVHVQSFLGCGSMVDSDGDAAWASPTQLEIPGSDSTSKSHLRTALKRSLQLYTYRLFLLDGTAHAVRTFVDAIRDGGPNLDDLESLEAQGRAILKDRAMKDLHSIQAFLDGMQGTILEACHADFVSIASRDEYAELFPAGSDAGAARRIKDAPWFDAFVREAVREQVEIEVYVPLRGVASRWLVRGWRHEDMEVQFKIKELRRRRRQHPLLYGQAPSAGVMNSDMEDSSSSNDRWSARASKILSDRVGGSTLPCVKLRAIVDAARELSDHFAAAKTKAARSGGGAARGPIGSTTDPWLLGADDFLPLFMHCVVQADIERPCALCVLLKTLCDPRNRTGEIGYYLASFEATIAHIQEFDLSATATDHDSAGSPTSAVDNEENDFTSFLSVPLNASP